jgi:gamma-glutamyl phosphate reductase
MLLSNESLFSDDQAITATAVSTNVYDLGVRQAPYGGNALIGDVGKGTPVPVLIQVTEDFNNATSVTVALEVSANANMSSATVVNSETILLADLKAGKQTFMQYLPNGLTGRYLAVRYTVAGTAPSAGKFTAGISMGNQTNIHGA